MLTFPVTLSYIVIVQRAMDVRILLRMGTNTLSPEQRWRLFSSLFPQ